MRFDLNDTIVALSSAQGRGSRAIVRFSGPDALRLAGTCFLTSEPLRAHQRRMYAGQIQLPGIRSPLPASLSIWPAPRTYTGQAMAELHTLACLPLVDLLIANLLNAGARAAAPGEFTLRAFLAGKVDLTRAEAVLGVIEAGNREELKQALTQLAGSVTRPLQQLRAELLDVLADVEAGLDFIEEDIHTVSEKDLLQRLTQGLALLTLLQKQLEQRSLADRPFRAVLTGRPNVGKSSLFNALAGTAAALTSSQAGTTRDYLTQRLTINDVVIELVDTAGWQESGALIEQQAKSLGRDQIAGADLILLCVESGQCMGDAERLFKAQYDARLQIIITKCDLEKCILQGTATSAKTGAGLDRLRHLIVEQARNRKQPMLAPSLSRCRHHVSACQEHLRQAYHLVLYQDPAELLALELHGALDELGAMVGAVYTDDLLDRIFSRFCIGK